MRTSATGSEPAEAGVTVLRRRSAEHGFTVLRRRSAEHGFTLVELMVVLVILGLTSAAVLFALPGPAADVRGEAERFAARVRAAQDDAILTGRPLSLTVDAAGYRFDRRIEGAWTAPTEPALAPRIWDHGVTARVAGEGQALFDPTGGTDPLAVTLSHGDARAQVRVAADGSVHVG